MTDPAVIPAPAGGRNENWLDVYMPEAYSNGPRPGDKLISLAVIRGIIFRQRWTMLAAVAVSIVIGIVLTLLATPIYQASSRVAYEPYGANVVQGQDVNPGSAGREMITFLGTQGQIIGSRSMAEVVVDGLMLAERSDLLGPDINKSRPAGITDQQWLAKKRDMAASILTGSVSVAVPVRDWVITITYTSTDPVLAAQIANGYADAVVSSSTRTSLEGNQYALAYLREQIASVREKLSAAEQETNAYARNYGIVVETTSAEEGGSRTLTSANLSSINQRVTEARAARIAAEQRWRSVQTLPAAQLPEAQTNPTLLALISERSAKQGQLIELRQRYNDDFPQIANLIAQIHNLDVEIERAYGALRETYRTQFVIARNQENALEQELASLKSETLLEQDRRVELGVLDREAEALRTQLQELLARYNQINSAAEVEKGDVKKIDAARTPSAPSSPNVTRNLFVATVLGIFLAAALAFLRETLDDRVRTIEDVEDKLGLTPLGYTPYIENVDIEAEETNRFSTLMESYTSIRAAIDFSLPRDQNILQLTSSKPGEGKSTTSVILAELFAALGRKTLLIDADLRRPSVAALLGIEPPKVGLVEVLLGHVALEDAIVKGIHENLYILPVGETPPNPSEIFALPEMRQFLERCREEYSLVILDSCPVMGIADAPMLANLVDRSIFVLEANKVPFGQARAAIRRLTGARGRVIGVIVTKYKALEAGQSYDYQYGYYQYGRVEGGN
jgi:polysaccharide biosynthesis transport protein